MLRGGQGAPLLYLHGALGVYGWTPFMEQLSQRFDVIVPDHPGFGESDTPDWLDNVGDLAYFYLDVMQALRLTGVHLSGTSLGGWIAAEIAVRDCHPLKSLTLTAPAGIHVKGLSKGDFFMWSPEQFVRNLYARSDGRRRDAGAAGDRGAAVHRDEEPARDREARLAAAALQSASRQVAASHQRADADPVGRRRQDHPARLRPGVPRSHSGARGWRCSPIAATSRISNAPTRGSRRSRASSERRHEVLSAST